MKPSGRDAPAPAPKSSSSGPGAKQEGAGEGAAGWEPVDLGAPPLLQCCFVTLCGSLPLPRHPESWRRREVVWELRPRCPFAWSPRAWPLQAAAVPSEARGRPGPPCDSAPASRFPLPDPLRCELHPGLPRGGGSAWGRESSAPLHAGSACALGQRAGLLPTGTRLLQLTSSLH